MVDRLFDEAISTKIKKQWIDWTWHERQQTLLFEDPCIINRLVFKINTLRQNNVIPTTDELLDWNALQFTIKTSEKTKVSMLSHHIEKDDLPMLLSKKGYLLLSKRLFTHFRSLGGLITKIDFTGWRSVISLFYTALSLELVEAACTSKIMQPRTAIKLTAHEHKIQKDFMCTSKSNKKKRKNKEAIPKPEISFNDTESVLVMGTNQTDDILAPKSIERLEEKRRCKERESSKYEADKDAPLNFLGEHIGGIEDKEEVSTRGTKKDDGVNANDRCKNYGESNLPQFKVIKIKNTFLDTYVDSDECQVIKRSKSLPANHGTKKESLKDDFSYQIVEFC